MLKLAIWALRYIMIKCLLVILHIKICERLNIDPLKFISSGSMLITTTCGKKLAEELISKGIPATVIGNITESRGILVIDEIEKDVLPPTRDELFSI